MRYGVLIVGLLVLMLAANCSAEFISLSSSVDLDNIINESKVEATITIMNEGDEPAYDVIVEPSESDYLTVSQIALGNINPNQTVTGVLNLEINEDAMPGKYSTGLLIRYNDLNNYPFTFVTPLKLFYKMPLQSNVVALLGEVELEGESTSVMTMKVQNRDDKDHTVKAKLYTPNQISVEDRERTLNLVAGTETEVEFTIHSLGALEGGNFFVFATLDYDEGDKHYSVMSSSGRIITAGESSFMGDMAPIIGALVVVLVIVLIYMQLKQDNPVKPAKK